MTTSLLDIDGLSVEYETEEGMLRAVDDVNLSIREGEILGLVGESGCGKTTLAKAIPGLLPKNSHIPSGEIQWDGRDLTELSVSEIKAIRWKEIAYIVQNAMNALDPVYNIRSQFVEVMRAHSDRSKSQARERAEQLMEAVNLDPSRLRDYPHELSGGQRQRVVIALALALDPPLILADEPTTGLDVVVQDEILELLTELQTERELTMVLITHDISAVAEIADRVAVMYGGRIAELGGTSEVFKRSGHPYTMGLANAFPSLERNPEGLVSIPGAPPNLVHPPDGCRFTARCPFATEHCEVEGPPLIEVEDGHEARCHYTDQAPKFRERATQPGTWEAQDDD